MKRRAATQTVQVILVLIMVGMLLFAPLMRGIGAESDVLLLKLLLTWTGGWGLILGLNGLLSNFRRRDFPRWLESIWIGGRPPQCLYCNYDLRGSDGKNCPECGERIPHLSEFMQLPSAETK